MGSFYTNVTLKGPSQDAITAARTLQGRSSIVTPSRAELTVVFDAASEAQDGSVNEVARELSVDLRCIALAVTNHDDSVLYFQVFKDGELLDEYDSCPSYFEDTEPVPPRGGSAELLCELFHATCTLEGVEEILRFDSLADDTDDRYVFESERHADLVRALTLSSFAIGSGFNTVVCDELPEGLSLAECRVLD